MIDSKDLFYCRCVSFCYLLVTKAFHILIWEIYLHTYSSILSRNLFNTDLNVNYAIVNLVICAILFSLRISLYLTVVGMISNSRYVSFTSGLVYGFLEQSPFCGENRSFIVKRLYPNLCVK